VAALAKNIVIKRLPPACTAYGAFSDDFDFILSFDADRETQPGLWWSTDLPAVCSQISEPFISNCVAPSGTLMATGTQYLDPAMAAATTAMAELDTVVRAIQEHRPLVLQQELDDLLTRALQSRGQPGNIEAWAHQLANDIRNLTD